MSRTPPVAEWVVAVFDLGRVGEAPIFAARGELGEVWRLTTDRGTWAVKRLLAPIEASTGDDVDFQLAALAAGVSLPRPVRTVTGAAVAVGPDGVGHRVYEWVDFAADGRVDPAVAGELLGRIHFLAWPATEVDPWYREPPPTARWPALVAAAREARAPWAGLLEERVGDIVVGIEVALGAENAAGAGGLIRCHLDFNADNVLLDRDGRTWLIDWENSGGAFASQELAQALVEFGGVEGAEGQFLAGYASSRGPARLCGLGDFAMAFVVQANLLAFYARRWLDGDAASRARDEWRLNTQLPDMLTIGRAQQLLADHGARARGLRSEP
jgi:Ser/Thr protein kinase RdoA (MazF antagonist)